MQVTPLQELNKRIHSLKQRMEKENIDGVLLTERIDLFYFAGSLQQGFLFIPLQGEPLYMVRRRITRALEESRLENIVPLKSLKNLPTYIKEHSGSDIKKLGLELDILPVKDYFRLQELFAPVDFIDFSTSIKEVRMIKSAYELNFFRRAGEIAAYILEQVPALLEVGKPEIVLASEVESLYRKAGHQGIIRMRSFNTEMFFGHVYSGRNGALGSFLDTSTAGKGLTAASPQGPGWKQLAPNEPIGLDYASLFEGYTLDHTRLFAIGSLPDEIFEAYSVSRYIQDEVTKKAAPGVYCSELYELALSIADSYGLKDFFMGYDDGQVKFIGHGVGLDLDEYPILSPASPHVLQEGMVFALEPKFIFPEIGMVGLENVWTVTETGLERLSPGDDEVKIVNL